MSMHVYYDDEDSVRSYLSKAGRIPLLTKKEEKTLFLVKKRGDAAWKEARKRVAAANIKLVANIAKKYLDRGLHLSDLIGAGNVGLMIAIDKFSLARGTRFSTYATYWIKQTIRRSVGEHKTTVRMPEHRRIAIAKYARVKEDLLKNGCDASDDVIAEKMGVSTEEIEFIVLMCSMNFISLDDSPFSDKQTGSTMHNVIGCLSDETLPSTHVANAALEKRCKIAIQRSKLTPQEKTVILMYFGIFNGIPMTAVEIAEKFSVKHQRICQIKKKALEKLKRSTKMRELYCA